jgi:hypothetical protein
MSYEKEGATMRAVWLETDELEEPEESALGRRAAYADLETEDTLVQEDRPIARRPAFMAIDDDDLWEIPMRLAP